MLSDCIIGVGVNLKHDRVSKNLAVRALEAIYLCPLFTTAEAQDDGLFLEVYSDSGIYIGLVVSEKSYRLECTGEVKGEWQGWYRNVFNALYDLQNVLFANDIIKSAFLYS